MLNPPQKAAVESVNYPLLVLAGAGCGKTRVITEKMAHLVRVDYCLPEQIFAITFTNKAAKEMHARAVKLVSGGDALNISTFHALGLRILQQEAEHTPYHRGFSILDTSECQKVLQGLLPKGIKKDVANQLQWQISGWKNAALKPNEVVSKVPVAVEIYQHYLDYMVSINAMDFDDLILQPLWLLSQSSAVLSRWQSKIKYMLVDEYQDTNASQYQLLKMLMGSGQHLTCVGDDDQSIYGWRGAQAENLQLLQQDFTGLKVVKLEQNYRSTSTILSAANAVIKNNPHPIEKKIWSDLGEGDPIQILAYPNAETEAEQVIADIRFNQRANQKNFNDFAILYRSNHQAKLLEQALRMNDVPYHMSGGRSFFDYSEIKDVMAYIRLLANPRDNAAFLRVINTPKRGIGMQTVQHISAAAKGIGQSFLAASKNAQVLQGLPAAAQDRVKAFTSLIHQHQKMQHSAEKVISSLLQQIDYISYVSQSANNKLAKMNKTKLVQDFIKWIDALGRDQHLAIDELLNYLSLQTSQEDDNQEDAVRMMTLHAAKGLEFEHVYLVGVEEGILPHANSLEESETEDDAVEEERRLMYVGMTRAMQQLKISFVKKRKKRFADDNTASYSGASRFLDEIPHELSNGHPKVKKTAAEQQASNKSNFAAIKAMLE
ncbi:UvrD-helicase domain-containing protein [Marinicella sp. S1101]|uniref:ATP-dependent helicase n=1 Tax=Marinicella marina TaxID=2996016 RepID=UPI002260A550|nr:UvrD-helicase domain-containing protein [Marinicella marina]MCX7552411.1 UvrD-helicase domain-containing protein [Marinicella marina]MDJ1139286.1 3'-5' exonuclease [Marinicella marina]